MSFFSDHLWNIRLKNLPWWKALPYRFLRIIFIAFQGFNEDKVQQQASALTFYSLLSIVPVVALLFAIAKGFGLERKLETEIRTNFEGHEEVLNQVFSFSTSLLDNTQGGLIAGIGVVVLLWSVMKVLGNIEESFNSIWQVKKSRTLIRKFTEYLSIMLVSPILVILSSSVTVFISTQVEGITESNDLIGSIGPALFFLVKLTPYAVFMALFTFLYMVMPNTKVNWRAALIAGVLAGTAFELTQFAYINFQFGMARYNAIYGSFAALPLFLVWLQISWLIVLFGAEISFAYQHVDQYQFRLDSREISPRYVRLIALLLTHELIRLFDQGKPPPNLTDISDNLDIPKRLTSKVMERLVHSKMVNEVLQDDEEVAYQPASSTDRITLVSILTALDQQGVDELPLARSPQMEAVEGRFEELLNKLESAPENILIRQIKF